MVCLVTVLFVILKTFHKKLLDVCYSSTFYLLCFFHLKLFFQKKMIYKLQEYYKAKIYSAFSKSNLVKTNKK